MGEIFKQKRTTPEEWVEYRKTQKQLVDALENHKKSIEMINPYTCYNDGSWEMSNESMGLYDICKLYDIVAPKFETKEKSVLDLVDNADSKFKKISELGE